MRHKPFFRWVLTLGFVLSACGVGISTVQPEPKPVATRQIDLAVVEEKPDGACRVRWSDPYAQRVREEPYRCDPTRSSLLKAPNWGDSRGYGWQSAFMYTEGPDQGDLEDPDAGVAFENDGDPGGIVLAWGILAIAVGLVGGNLRALPRTLGVEARLVRRATALAEAAGWTARDHERAMEAARGAGRQGEFGAAPDPELVRALWVLREAGPESRRTAQAARELSDRLAVLLEEAAPAAGLGNRLRSGPAARAAAETAVAELRRLLAEAERDGLQERFAQTSVDLLRGQDSERAALASGADFERDPEAYRRLFEELAPREPAALPEPRR
ncbi:hypothetical protein ACIGHB_25180 [Streptomyces sp. NPDC085460]|uniref:hypothetical protein n=1 Tax=Streptomyces sp. NPDC085460 TaxID=3365723 RepID=UPI0037D0CA36